jgi:hypothetical protein
VSPLVWCCIVSMDQAGVVVGVLTYARASGSGLGAPLVVGAVSPVDGSGGVGRCGAVTYQGGGASWGQCRPRRARRRAADGLPRVALSPVDV